MQYSKLSLSKLFIKMYEFNEDISEDEDFLELVDAVMNPRMPRTFRERPDHFTKWKDNEFLQRFRLTKNTVAFITESISPAISSTSRRNQALSASEMVLLTLRFLATGCILQVAGDFSGVDKSTASRVINKVIRAIAHLHETYISLPNEEINIVRQEFFNISRFPRCIGALDCTHVRIQSPGGGEPENFRNRKGYFSFNVQAICDSQLKIWDIVCRWPGSAHDANIFRNSIVRAGFENGEFGENLLVGDSGYGIKPYLITPLSNPRTAVEHLFNESQIRTRNPIERCFGVLKRRFPILPLGIKLNVQKVEAIVVSCAVLHNIACILRDDVPLVNEEIELAIELGNMAVPVAQPGVENIALNNIVRQALINEYFQPMLNNVARE